MEIAALMESPEALAQAIVTLEQRLNSIEERQPQNGLAEHVEKSHNHNAAACIEADCPACAPARNHWVAAAARQTRAQIFEQLAQAAEATELVPQLNQIAQAYARMVQGLAPVGEDPGDLDLGDIVVIRK